MYKIDVFTTRSGRTSTIEISTNEELLKEKIDHLLSYPYKVKKDTWMVEKFKGFTFFEPDSQSYEPERLATLLSFVNKYGLAAEVFAQEIHIEALKEHFEECYIDSFPSLRKFAECCRRRGIFRNFGLIGNENIELKAIQIIQELEWTAFNREGVLYVFDGLNLENHDSIQEALSTTKSLLF